MATLPALSTDPSKINPAGAEPSDIEEYQKSLADQIYQLEQRYAQPNWFKIAAGFAKPQLGGFLSSLGSAAEAQGETVEQQRAMGLPIAQMRTQLAQSKIAMGQNQKAASIYESHKGPVTEELVKELVRLAPDAPSTKAAQAQLAAQQKRQELTSGATNTIITALNAKVASGKKLSPEENAILDNAVRNLSNQPSAKEQLPLGNPNVKQDNFPTVNQTTNLSAAVNPNQQTNKIDLSAFDKEVKALDAKIKSEGYTAENKKAFADLKQRQSQAMQGQVVTTQQPAPESNKPYPETVPRPNLEGELPRRQQQLEEEYTKNADAMRARHETTYNNAFEISNEPNWSVLSTATDGSLKLIKDHPDTAKKVFNMIRGDGELKNQVMALIQSGIGVNINGFNGALNIDVNAMQRAGIPPAEQAYADTLARNMLTIGLARLQAEGRRPEKGAEAYANALTAKANLGETAISAYKALLGEQVTFDTLKGIHDTINREKAERRHNPNSATPISDIYLNSKEIKRIENEALERRREINKEFEDYIKQQKAKRNKKD
jgi:hypothetical protein